MVWLLDYLIQFMQTYGLKGRSFAKHHGYIIG